MRAACQRADRWFMSATFRQPAFKCKRSIGPGEFQNPSRKYRGRARRSARAGFHSGMPAVKELEARWKEFAEEAPAAFPALK